MKINKKLLIVIIFILLILTLGFVLKNKLSIDNYDKGEWIVVEDKMSKLRPKATANLLPDGNILIMGGEYDSADTADIFDPNQNKIIKTIQLNDKRYSGYATIRLKNGDIYIVGGILFSTLPTKDTNTTKIFDSKNYKFKDTKEMKYYLFRPLLVNLENDNILILHNHVSQKNLQYEVYNPYKNEYYLTENSTNNALFYKRCMKLNDGKILIFERGSAYIYDYKTNKFNIVENELPQGALFVALDNNSYLIIEPHEKYSEGYIYNIENNKKISVKNRINNTWNVASDTLPQTICLDDGNVLIVGMNINKKSKKRTEYSTYIYEKDTNRFYKIKSPPIKVHNAGICKSQDGNIILAGGTIQYRKYSDRIQIYKKKKKEVI